MARHQNQAVKRARERNKRLKAEDKRAKRQKKKELTQDNVEPRHSQAVDDDGGSSSQPREGAAGDGQDAARGLQSRPPI
jgi:hypothetical protein